MNTILILGGTSDMAIALAQRYISIEYTIILAGRSLEKLDLIKKDLEIRQSGVVEMAFFDAEDFDSHDKFFKDLSVVPDITVCLFGYLGAQETAKTNWQESSRIINTNYAGAVSILNVVSEVYKVNKKGTIVGISSVAGERGRQSNYLYGSAKAGFTAYLSGLRSEMFKHGLHVLTVKPGFVNTKMTEELDLPKPITTSPATVAKAIQLAVKKKKNVVYVLPVWRLIMWIIRSIPEFVFKRMKL